MPKWFIYTIITFIIFLVIFVGSIWICKKFDIEITTSDIKDCLGIVISCASLLITAFFVVMAVSAYSHVKEIEDVRKSADELENRIKDADKISHDIFDIMISYTEDLIRQAEKNKEMNNKSKFLTLLYRFGAYKYPQYHDVDTRQSYLLNLASFGDASDIIHLEKICSDPNEPPEIRETAQAVIEKIKNKIINQQKGGMPNTKREEKLKKTLWLNKILNFFKIG